jgi:hypothetical protein
VQKTRAAGAPAPPPPSIAAGENTSSSKNSRVNVAEMKWLPEYVRTAFPCDSLIKHYKKSIPMEKLN